MSNKQHLEIIVIKVGSNTLSSHSSTNGINLKFVSELCDVVAQLIKDNYKVILVSSGAMVLGLKKLKITKRPKTVTEKQVATSIGQPELIRLYDEEFSKHKILVAQFLFTRDGFNQREYYLNARETLLQLLNTGSVPVINENDTVANDEIKFGDNDNLSALVADLISADKLIILTDEDGLYDKNPKKYKTAKFIPIVEEVTPRIEKIASDTVSELSHGGMLTKVQAAKLATNVGIQTHVINGDDPKKILDLLNGKKIGTIFLPTGNKIEKRKRWITNGLVTQGKIYVDRGAQQAISDNGKSLLPPGIKQIIGTFERGAAIEIYLQYGNKAFAKGITNYGKHELEKIVGLKSSEIQKVLGYTYGETVIHRDDLVLLK